MSDIKFDSSKDYTWSPSEEFTLSGIEFGNTLNYLKSRKVKLLKELEIINTFERKLVEAVESGKVKEKEKESV